MAARLLRDAVEDLLPSQFVLIQDHVGVVVAPGARPPEPALLDVEDEGGLPHEGAAQEHLVRARETLHRETVTVSTVPKQVLAREPLHIHTLPTDVRHHEVQHWIALEVLSGPLGKLGLIVSEADAALFASVPYPEAVGLAESAEPVEVNHEHVE